MRRDIALLRNKGHRKVEEIGAVEVPLGPMEPIFSRG
jgi:hypothetical protein